jgi:hypothetical protein
MRIGALLIASTLLFVSDPALADEGRGGQIVGNWNVTADSLGAATYTVTFERDGNLSIEMSAKSNGGESHSNATGPGWKQEPGNIVFDGSATVDQLKIGGTWKITWNGAGAFTAKTDDGKTYKLTRLKEAQR